MTAKAVTKVEKTELAPRNKLLESLFEMGIPIQTAVFHRTVQSFGATAGAGEPETAFYASGAKPSRTAKMFFTPHGLLCEQRFGSILVPLPNVSFVRL